jgi:hypothetical protein
VLERTQLAVCHVEEIATAARRIKHTERAQLSEDMAYLGKRCRGVEARSPWFHDRRADDLHDVDFVGVVRAELPPPIVAEAALHQRSEDRRVDLAPVELRRFPEHGQVVLAEMYLRRCREQGAVNVACALQHTVAAIVIRVVSVASLARYTRVSPDALTRWQARRDPHRRR